MMGRRKEVSAALSFSSFPSPIARFSFNHAARVPSLSAIQIVTTGPYESSPDGFLYLGVRDPQTSFPGSVGS